MKHMMVILILALLVSSAQAEIFRDNFNDGDLKGWTFVLGAENGGIQNGELVLSSPKPEREAEVIIAVNGIIASDYEVAVSLKISDFFGGDFDGGPSIRLRAHTPPFVESIIKSNPALENRWLLYEQSYKFFLGINHRMRRRGLGSIIQRVNVEANLRNGLTVVTLKDSLRAFRLFDFKLHKWYRLKVIAKGDRFQCFIDDKKMLDFLDDTYTEGRICLSSGLGNHVHFDDFEVQYEALSVQPRRQLTTTWGKIKSNLH
ncbi:DUF1080 domain-containing protein [Candidatus Poribacteria bacterium]|nr:DUF1080 domain-containing protein [Candidatus Poribacteria bacterium]